MNAPTRSELEQAYRGRRVLLTGHTGFKGGWLTLWLQALGAEVHGYALAPESAQGVFAATGAERDCRHRVADVRDPALLQRVVAEVRPAFVFHLAAQPLVRRSYEAPLETLQTNVMGTAHVLEAVRQTGLGCAIVVVTSDKCYENREWVHGYREEDPVGGHDVYSMSKGATELVVSSYRRSFFPVERIDKHGVRLASARAGNVIGGGDWAQNRIVPDAIRALAAGEAIPVRNPRSVRPWQHVLEPLGGYLLLGARLAGVGAPDPAPFAEAWNFGPQLDSARPVRQLVEQMVQAWGAGSWEDRSDPDAPHEAALLRLSIEKAQALLGWMPRWSFAETVDRTVAWYRAQARGASSAELRALCLAQIDAYQAAAG